ncbi:sensor histidine kinase [Halorientalis pallida]|uniref:histidine kinase n=1 Tax=Halorientalis pallida TaxID=2479928 RepID=A0A498KZ29_9EURY|nr:HAMP domain-containing sensor histidine kinase [Halorientalis pallida]RXK49450.1 HAMP domain-containing histidine kinase [Halorientalis pallida]
MNPRRLLAGASVSLTGVGIVVPTVSALSAGGLGLYGSLVAGIGVVLGLLLVAGGAWLARSELAGNRALRVAGWNLLGLVALGTVLLLVLAYPGATLPPFVAAVVLGVSAVAHVLIGVNDVRRIRAGELAKEREKLAVLNRLTRHNLRNDTQVIIGLADVLAEKIEDEALAEIARSLRGNAEGLAGLNDTLKEYQEAVEHTPRTESVVALDDLAERVVAEAGADGTVEIDVPEGLSVRADDHLETALAHLVENSFEYAGAEPRVRVTARRDGDVVVCTVTDDGPGIPDVEREVVLGERDITQLEHGTGLGLWTVRAITESYGGEVAIRSDDGAAVDLRLPAA